MKKINLDSIISQSFDEKDEVNTFKNKCLEYEKLIISKKDSLKKIDQIKDYYDKKRDTNFSLITQKYINYKNNNPDLLNSFLLEEPLFSEYLDEDDYVDVLNSRIKNLLRNDINLYDLQKGGKCYHQFAILNDKLLCTKCSLNENDIIFNDDEELKFFIKTAKEQGMYIGKITDDDLPLLELLKLDNDDLKSSSDNKEIANIYHKYIKEARKLDDCRYDKSIFDKEKSQELISKIHEDIKKIINEEYSNLEIHKLKLEEAFTAYVEILILSGKSIPLIYSIIDKNNIEVLAKAIDHLNNHKELLTYFENVYDEKNFDRIYTTIPEINKKILSMKRR